MAIWDVQKQRTALVININDYPYPEWSPTESRIAFRDADAKLVKIHNLNDGTKQQYEDGHIGNWSPDGHYLTIEHDDNAELQIIDTHTQKPVEFDGDIGALGVGPRIDWSSDSRYLVTSSLDKDHPDNNMILVVDMLKRSIQSTKITVPDYVQLTWSPQGNRFAFASNTEYLQAGALSTSLWLYDVDDQQRYHYETKISGYYYSSLSRFNWSSTGLYMTVQTDSGTALLDWASKQLKPLRTDGQSLGQPRWSPNGTKLALSSGSWDTGDIYVFIPKENTFKDLTHTPDEGEIFLGWRGANQNDSMIGPCGET
jgi:Tol biopolymer transport system component